MPDNVFCEDCQRDVRDCEHLSGNINPADTKKMDRENDLAYLDSRMHELWVIVYAEDLGRPTPSREESARASDELDRLTRKHHDLTREPDCDCHTCLERGFVPTPKPEPESLSRWFRADPFRDDWMEAPCPWGAMHIMRVRDGIIMPDGSCGPSCLCNTCMERKQAWGDDRRFYVVDGLGAIVVLPHELADFLRAHPQAREVR